MFDWSKYPKLAPMFEHRPEVNVYWQELLQLVAELSSESDSTDYRTLLKDLVEALPKCEDCSRPATRAYQRGSFRWCDEHGVYDAGRLMPVPEYPRAPALRAAVAALGKSK